MQVRTPSMQVHGYAASGGSRKTAPCGHSCARGQRTPSDASTLPPFDMHDTQKLAWPGHKTVYRLAERGPAGGRRTFIMHSKDFHRSHNPIRCKEHLAKAPDPAFLERVDSATQLPRPRENASAREPTRVRNRRRRRRGGRRPAGARSAYRRTAPRPRPTARPPARSALGRRCLCRRSWPR